MFKKLKHWFTKKSSSITSPDIINITVSYLSPHQLKKFFDKQNLSHNIKFLYDASSYPLERNEFNFIFDRFPNVQFVGLNLRSFGSSNFGLNYNHTHNHNPTPTRPPKITHNLKRIIIRNIDEHQCVLNVGFLNKCTNLELLEINSFVLINIPLLHAYTKLRHIDLTNCETQNFDSIKLDSIKLQKIHHLVLPKENPLNTSHITGAKNLRYIHLTNVNDSQVELNKFTKLRTVCFSHSKFQILICSPNLRHLRFENCHMMNKLPTIECPNLESIEIINCTTLVSINNIPHCTNLKRISCKLCPIKTLSILSACTNLHQLKLESCPIRNLDGLRHSNIQSITLRDCKQLRNADFLESCSNLKDVTITDCTPGAELSLLLIKLKRITDDLKDNP